MKATLYTWVTCPFCINAKSLLDSHKIEYQEFVIKDNIEEHERLFNETKQRTVPYIYLDNKFIGGYTDLKALLNEKQES